MDNRMDLQGVGCEYMDWIGLAQDRDRWRTLGSVVLNLRVPWNAENFLTSFNPVRFSRKTLHHGVSKYYSSWWTLASSEIILHYSRFCDLRLQLLKPIFFRSSSSDSSHLNLGFPIRRAPSGLRSVRFLQGSSFCIVQILALKIIWTDRSRTDTRLMLGQYCCRM